MRLQTRIIDREMGEKAKRLPPAPRIRLNNNVEILPLVDDDWQPVEDKWVMPGCGVLTTQEIRSLADARGLAFELVN